MSCALPSSKPGAQRAGLQSNLGGKEVMVCTEQSSSEVPGGTQTIKLC